MAMQTDIRNWCGVGSVDRQAGTAPGPQPQRGPPSTTGGNSEINSRSNMNDKPSLIFSQWNAEGVRKKKLELQQFLQERKIDVMCIQETHLSEPHRFCVRGYQAFRNDRENRLKGGVLTLIRNSIPATEIKRSTANSGTEFITVKIILPEKEILVMNVYCPSDREIETSNFPNKENTIILGDFNSHSPSWGYDTIDNRGEIIEDWLIENKFILINKPDDEHTFWSRAWKSSSTPDLAFASENIQKVSSRTVCDQLGGSDHRPVIIKLHNQPTGRYFCKEPSWNFKKANWSKFDKLSESMCERKPFVESNNIHRNVENFTSGILEAAKCSIPRGRRYDYKPYWSDQLNELHNNMSKARDNMETFPNSESISAHSRARELYEEEKIQSSQKAWKEKTESLNMERDGDKIWKLTNSLNDDLQDSYKPTVLKNDNEEILTGKKAADKLAEHFKEISNLKIPREKANETRQQIKHESRNQQPNECMTANFTMQELNKAIHKLKNKKAPGPDGITNEMIKHLSNYAKNYLLQIFNQSWNTGTFPQYWKEATIIPIPKKGKDRTQSSGYRPISLLSCLGKLMERLVNNRLQYHLEKNGLLNPIQSGYRKNRSTEDQVTLLVQEIENAFQEKMKTIAVFVDLTAAFDKVWKDGLLLKLLRKQVNGNMFQWIKNFLFQRTARVKIDGYKSSLVKLREGVPQGGVISPTLFIIFIDDITEKLTTHISRALHADDLAVWTASENLSTAYVRMQMTMEKIGKWADEWLVTINKKKTEATVFSLSPKKEEVNLKINGESIPQQDTPTYLGVKLDKRLTWAPHIANMESKAIKKMAVMKKLAGTKWGANANILKQVYSGSVRPQLEYGATSWGTAAKTNTNKLNKVQNASLRIITGAMKTTPITEMEKTAKIQPLDDRRKEKVLIQGEKMKRLPSHPLHKKLGEHTKSRLKRSSPNHCVKVLQKKYENTLPQKENAEKLIDFEEWNVDETTVKTSIPGIGPKETHSEAELKNLALEHLNSNYPVDIWTHAYTDGSAEDAVKNGGGGVYIKFSNGNTESKSFSTGKNSTNYRAEAKAILTAVQTLNNSEFTSNSTVILTDCRSILESIQSGEETQTLNEIKSELTTLKQKTNLTLQWIPSHCGIQGNDKADELSKLGSKLNQDHNSISYQESKTIIKSTIKQNWKKENNIEANDSINQLNRKDQVLIFRLRTGHCRLNSHMYKLKLSHTDECPCETGIQTPEHLLQHCPTYNIQRQEIWQGEVSLQDKLYGTAANLQRTAEFVTNTGLTI